MNTVAPRIPAWPVVAAWLGSMVLLFAGLVDSPFRYGDARFVAHYVGTEAAVAAWLALLTFVFLSPRRCGFRVPEWAEPSALAPLLLQLGLAALTWGWLRSQAPAGAGAEPPAWQLLRTTLLVGLTEEWVYRGLLLALLTHCWGWRRGAGLSLVAFGALHWLNLGGGQSLAAVLIQSVLAALSGATLLLAAVGTRSLLVPMLAHGLFDFFVIDGSRLPHGPTGDQLALLLLAAGPLIGLFSLWRLMRHPRGEPYAD